MWKLKHTILAFAVVPLVGLAVAASSADDEGRVEVETGDNVAVPEERPEQGERIEQHTATLDDQKKRMGDSSDRPQSEGERDIFRNAIETVPAE